MGDIRVLFVEVTTGQGGSTTCLVRLVPNLMKHGVRPSLLVYRTSPRIEALKAHGVPVHDLDLDGVVPPDPLRRVGPVTAPTRKGLRIVAGALRAIALERPDVVYFNSPIWPHLPAVAAALGARRRTICHLRETVELTRAERAALLQLDASIALTDAARDIYLGQGLPAERLFRVYDAVDVARMDERLGAAPERAPGGPFTLAMVASLIDRKGHEIVFRALRGLLDGGVDVRLLCAGDGELRAKLEAMVADLGLGAVVTFLGQIGDVPALLKRSDASVMASLQEGLPQAVLEAMAARRPVIMTDLTGVRELITDGVSGLIVPPGDVDAMARAIATLAGDEALRARLGEAGRAVLDAPRFRPEAETEGVLEIIRRVAGR